MRCEVLGSCAPHHDKAAPLTRAPGVVSQHRSNEADHLGVAALSALAKLFVCGRNPLQHNAVCGSSGPSITAGNLLGALVGTARRQIT